jgi:hypothetical protein
MGPNNDGPDERTVEAITDLAAATDPDVCGSPVTLDPDREDWALEALIVLALLDGAEVPDDAPDLAGMEQLLSAEDRRAIDAALGPDFLRRLLAGTWEPRERR